MRKKMRFLPMYHKNGNIFVAKSHYHKGLKNLKYCLKIYDCKF